MGTSLLKKRHNDLTFAAEVGARMQGLRLDRGLSLVQLYERGGPSTSHMSTIERGKVDFSTDTILKVAEALGVRPWQLLTDDQDLASLELGEAKRILFVNPEFVLPEPAEPLKKPKHIKGGKQ